jgi:hypothetical protein
MAWSFTWPRSDWPCSLAPPPCGASPRLQFQHLTVAVDDVEVAGGVHRHSLGAVEAGERQHGQTTAPIATMAISAILSMRDAILARRLGLRTRTPVGAG